MFGSLLPQIRSNIAEIITIGSTLAKKKHWKFFEWFELLWNPKFTDPKLVLLVQLWPHVYPWRWAKLKKIDISGEKLQPLGYPNLSKSRLHLFISSPLSGEIRLLSAIFGILRKHGGVTSQRVRIRDRIWEILFHPNNSWPTFRKKFWSQHFPVLWL